MTRILESIQVSIRHILLIGRILIIAGSLVAIFGYLYGTNDMYNCPSNGCDPHMFDKINTLRYTMLTTGISLVIIGAIIIVRKRLTTE